MTKPDIEDKSYLLDPAFELCLTEAIKCNGLLSEFDRLYGTNLRRRGAPLDLMVDDAVGKTKEDMGKFVDFVRDYVYVPMLNKFLEYEAREEPG